MPEYDGSVRIKTDIDAKHAKTQLAALENQMVKTADKIAGLRSKMEALKDTKIPTNEYIEIQNQISETEKKLAALQERKEKFLETGGNRNSRAFQSMQYDIEQLRDSLPNMKGELQDLIDTGNAFTLGGNTDEYAKMGQQLGYLLRQQEIQKQKHSEISQKIRENGKEYKKLGKDAAASFEKMAGGFKNGLKNIVKYAFGIRSLFALFKKMGSAAKEGFSNLYNSKVGDFAKVSDELKASLLTLKNSFASAFEPIATAVIPYIKQMVDWLNIALDKLAQFNAVIMGQQTYTKAIRQNTDAIKKNSAAQNRSLSSLDKRNVINSGSGGGGSGEDAAKNMFKEVPVDSKVTDWLETIKRYANDIKDTFAQDFLGGFSRGLGNIEPRIRAIKNGFDSIKKSLKNIFSDSGVQKSAARFASSFTKMVGSITGSVASMGLTIATNLVGGIAKYLEQNSGLITQWLSNMFDIGADISEMIGGFWESISYIFEAFASEDGQQLTANIIGIFADAFMGITELAAKLYRDIVNIITKPFIDNKEEFRQTLEGFLGTLSEVTGTIKQGIDDTFAKLNEVYDEHLKPFFDSVAQGLSDLTGEFLTFWNDNVQPMLDEWAADFDELWKEHLQPFVNKVADYFGKIADQLKVIWEKWLKPLISWIIQNVLPVLLPIINGLWKKLKTVWSGIFDYFAQFFDIAGNIIDFITNVFAGDWDKAWESIINAFKGAWNLIPIILETAINSVIDVINGILGGINELAGALKISVVPEISHVDLSLMKFDIPGYATGQVIPASMQRHLAILGDNNRETEVVSPLSTIKQALREELSQNGGGNGVIEIHVHSELNGREIGYAVQRFNLAESRRTNRPQGAY